MTMIRRISIQDGMKFYCQCQRFHPMMFWKACTNWEYVSLRNWNPYWNCTTCMEIHQKISMPIYQKLKTMVEEEYRSETSITKLSRQTRDNWNRSSSQESQGIEWRWRRKRCTCYQWKEKGKCSKGDRCSFRRESWSWKTETKSRSTLWATCTKRQKCVEKKKRA